MSEIVTREEFRMLSEQVMGNARRLDEIDRGGTRGVAVMAIQLQELAKDLASHEIKHDQEREQRASNRKWVWMAVIALVAAVDGPIVTVLLATHPH